MLTEVGFQFLNGYKNNFQHAWLGYEKQFMQPFYHFKFGERYYIGKSLISYVSYRLILFKRYWDDQSPKMKVKTSKAIDTQVYKLDNLEAQFMRQV